MHFSLPDVDRIDVSITVRLCKHINLSIIESENINPLKLNCINYLFLHFFSLLQSIPSAIHIFLISLQI